MALPRGRPKFDIDRAELLRLCQSGRSQKEIAEEYGVSRNTLRRIVKDKQITAFEKSNLTDNEIDQLILEMKCLMPYAGERLTIGYLKSKGYVWL